MSLANALKGCDLEMNPREIEAFFLGCLSAEKPMKEERALKELFLEDTKVTVNFESPAARAELEKELKTLWKDLSKNLEKRREKLLIIDGKSLKEEIIALGRLGDFFLMGMTLAGTSIEDQDDEAGDLLDEMEDHLLLFDDWVADEESRLDKDVWIEEGQKYKRELVELWSELCEVL
jgi:uncharacterized protein YgfB (UPF0149 family)